MTHRLAMMIAFSIAIASLASHTPDASSQPHHAASDPRDESPPVRVLFVRGADRSGGFLESSDDPGRTEQLADITNESTRRGNHGWFEFASSLRAEGFIVEQIIEPLELDAPSEGQTEGAPIAFDEMDLDRYGVIVMGSNNAVYNPAQIDAIERYVRDGGGVLFVSDANFGSDWPDASNSDQQFLDRFGWTMQQDQGTYVLRRANGDFMVGAHSILAGVDAFDGEGVSPIVVPEADIDGVRTTLLVRAKPDAQTRTNDTKAGSGSSRAVGPRDAALCIARVGRGRIAGHLDRNTFFNLNGAGTDINRFDNRAYAINLIRFLAFGEADAALDEGLDPEDSPAKEPPR